MMAIKVEGRLKPYYRGQRIRKYDWPNWLDGDQWLLVQEVDFKVSAESFRQQAQNAAGRRGCKMKTQVTTEDGMPAVVLQMIKPQMPKEKTKPLLQLPPPQSATAEATFVD